MSHRNMPSAAVQAYQAAGLGLPTAYEGFPFTPPSAAPWARLAWLPVSNDQRLYTVDRVIGILQVDLLYPAGVGTLAARTAADALAAWFAPRARFTYGGQAIAVRGCEQSAVRPSDGWLAVTVSVTFAAAVDR